MYSATDSAATLGHSGQISTAVLHRLIHIGCDKGLYINNVISLGGGGDALKDDTLMTGDEGVLP